MVVLSEKDTLPPPPPYFAVDAEQKNRSNSSLASLSQRPSSSLSRPRRSRLFSSLPAHVLLHIVYKTLPEPDDGYAKRRGIVETQEELARRTTRTLYWIAVCLRSVNRGFYLASMHILRSTYLTSYQQLVKAPYTSDPFPHSSLSSQAMTNSLQRETQILDLFILFKLKEEVYVDDTCLHVEREDTIKDLFDFMQPRSRLEDLVREFGVNAGLVSTSSVALPPRTSSLPRQLSQRLNRRSVLPFTDLSISLSPRRVGLVLLSSHSHSRTKTKRTIVEIHRDRNETLERCASRLIVELKAWIFQ